MARDSSSDNFSFSGGRHDDQVDALCRTLHINAGNGKGNFTRASEDGLLAYSSLLRSFKRSQSRSGSCSKCSRCLAVFSLPNLTVARTGTYSQGQSTTTCIL